MQCTSCGMQLSEATVIELGQDIKCPNCGVILQSFGPIRRYFSDIVAILTRPSSFFRKMQPSGGLARPLAFALVTHWIASTVLQIWKFIGTSQLTRNLFSGLVAFFNELTNEVLKIDTLGRTAQILEFKQRVTQWFWGVGPVILDPFITLIWIFYDAVLIWVGARIFITPGRLGALKEITFESSIRILCYAMTGSILGIIPFFGKGIGSLYFLILLIIGVKEVYHVPTFQSVIVALFPKFIYLGLILFPILAIIFILFNFFFFAF